MALTEQQLDELLKYLKEQIQYLVEQTDIEDDKAIQRLYINIQNLYKELNVLVADQLPETLLNAYTAGLAQANSLLTQAGISVAAASVSKIMQAPVHVEAINNIVSDTLSDLAAAFRTAEAYNYKEIDNVIKEVHDELANGMIAGLTREQIAKRVGQKFGQKGMTAFITKDGKHLPLDFYSRTVTRTKIQTATNHAHLNRYEEHDVKHVIVVGSIPTCAHCARYRGRVFATSRGDSDFPYLNLHATFPLHPNCRCNFRPFILKFKTKEEIEDAKKKAQEFKQLDEDADVRSDKEKSNYSVDQKAKRDERKKRLAYNNLKSRLGDKGPKDYNEFKNASKLKYHDWVAQAYKAYDPNKDTSRKPLQDEGATDSKQDNNKQEDITPISATRDHEYKDSLAKKHEKYFMDNFNNYSVEDMEAKNNYANLFNYLNETNHRMKFRTVKGRGADYSGMYGVRLSERYMNGIISDKEHERADAQITFVHEFGHAIDSNIFDKINKEGKEKKGERNINGGSAALHNLFEGLELQHYIYNEIMHNAITKYDDTDLKIEPLDYYDGKPTAAIIDDLTDKEVARRKANKEKVLVRDKKRIWREYKERIFKSVRQYAAASNDEYKARKENDTSRVIGMEQDILESIGFDTFIGHGSRYWNKFKAKKDGKTMRGLEVFAEFGEMFGDEDVYKFLHEKYPKTSAIYKEILKEAQHYIEEE